MTTPLHHQDKKPPAVAPHQLADVEIVAPSAPGVTMTRSVVTRRASEPTRDENLALVRSRASKNLGAMMDVIIAVALDENAGAQTRIRAAEMVIKLGLDQSTDELQVDTMTSHLTAIAALASTNAPKK